MSHYEPTLDEVLAQFPDPRDQAWFQRFLDGHDKELREEIAKKISDEYAEWTPKRDGGQYVEGVQDGLDTAEQIARGQR